MTTGSITTPENLVMEYQQTGSTLVFSSIYDFIEGHRRHTYTILRKILPESLLDNAEIDAIVDDSLLRSVHSYNEADSSVEFLSYFLETAKQTAGAFKRVITARRATLAESTALSQLVAEYQRENSVTLYKAIAKHPAIVAVAEEYCNYMNDPTSYSGNQSVIASAFQQDILENALYAAVMELPEGAELPAFYGRYLTAEFEYFLVLLEQ